MKYTAGEIVQVDPLLNINMNRISNYGGLSVSRTMQMVRGDLCKVIQTWDHREVGPIYKLDIDGGNCWYHENMLVMPSVNEVKKYERKLRRSDKPDVPFVAPRATNRRERSIVRAVNFAKNSEFGATAIKVELEGRTYRMDIGMDNDKANQFFLKKLHKYGLSTKKNGKYAAKRPLVYSRVYADGGDTEWTFTIDIKHPSTALLLPKFVRMFKSLATKSGKKHVEIEGAGMHISFLQSKDCSYPATVSGYRNKLSNYTKSVTPLLPAMFFMSANNRVGRNVYTRSLGPRPISIGTGKYNAIHYGNGCLEFRIFDTCYERPELLLDNVVAMSRTLKFWTEKYVKPKIKVADISFGGVEGRANNISLFYDCKRHIDILDQGLQIIKPNYKTTKELKKERHFKKTKANLPDTSYSGYSGWKVA